MKNIVRVLVSLVILNIMNGCSQSTKIYMTVPGKIKVDDIHKIAIMDFSSISTNSDQGMYGADQDLLKLAKDKVIDIFYSEPFYSFSNLEIENKIKDKKTLLKDRFDGLLYGKLWWSIAPEYNNLIPDKASLTTYKTVQYRCGKKKKQTCSTNITTSVKDKAYNKYYRVKSATLMMSLSLYKVSKNGKLTKITEIFEVGKSKYEILNGTYGSTLSVVQEPEKLDKLKSLQKNDGDSTSKTSQEVNPDYKLISNINTIPSNYFIKAQMIDLITKKLQKMITPTKVEFNLKVEKDDSKVEKLFDYSAYNSISSYIVETLLAGNNPKFYSGYYNIDFIKNTKNMLIFNHKRDFERENKNTKKSTIKYKPLDNKSLSDNIKKYLEERTPMIYNYAVATEAIGNYEKSLEIYRFLFSYIDNTNQDYANGIGRALLALDMNDKVNEERSSKIKAKNKNKI